MKAIIKKYLPRQGDWHWLNRQPEFRQLSGADAVQYALQHCFDQTKLSGQVAAKNLVNKINETTKTKTA